MPTPTFPTLASGYVAKFPLVRGRAWRSKVYSHADGSEQRFSMGYAPLAAFQLSYMELRTADKETLRTFWNSCSGSLSTSWSITLPIPEGSSTTWAHMQFVPGSTFEAREHSHGIWQVTLALRQTRTT